MANRKNSGKPRANSAARPVVSAMNKGLPAKVIDGLVRKHVQSDEKTTSKLKHVSSIVHLDEDTQKYSPKGRKLRKAFERPRPDLPSDAPANRTRKPVSLTLPPDLVDEVNAKVQALDVDRNAFIEAAIRLALAPK